MGIPIHKAKTHLSRLIERALAGEDIVISRGDVPVVRLTPIEPVANKRIFGAMRGEIRIDADFLEPMSEAEIAEWEG